MNDNPIAPATASTNPPPSATATHPHWHQDQRQHHHQHHHQRQSITVMAPTLRTLAAWLNSPTRRITVLFMLLCIVSLSFFATEVEFLPEITTPDFLMPEEDAVSSPLSFDERPSREAFAADAAEEWECLGWRATQDCSPDGALKTKRRASCARAIKGTTAGYCELRHRETGAIRKVMKLHCDSIKPKMSIKCADAVQYASYGQLAPSYVHDSSFSFEKNQKQLVRDSLAVPGAPKPASMSRGIIFVVYGALLPGAYASIRNLRAMGCTLPIELWSRPGEVAENDPIMLELLQNHGAYRRTIEDPAATKYFTKLYAIFYSAFNSVLLLDADNFAVRDPTYLFDTTEFQDTGALFWPDYRRPARRGDWDIVDHSLLWEILDMDFADMFEQESGQIVIDRRRHQRALNVLMFFGFHQPRILDDLMLVWGDKDLFRLAWLKTDSPFYWSGRPAGSAGQYDPKSKRFCGVTIVQHDPAGEIIFLHRNTFKLKSTSQHLIWSHIEQFKVGVPLSEYTVKSTDAKPNFARLNRCYGEDRDFTNYEITEVASLPFAGLESRLMAYVEESQKLKKQALEHSL